MSLPDNDTDTQDLPFSRFSGRKTYVLPFPPLPHLAEKSSDLAVVTWVAGESAYRWFSVTGPAMKRYSEKVGADFIVLDGLAGQPFALSNKFRVQQVFKEYGYRRVLFVDADLLLADHAINFFDFVPYEKVGILDEGALYDEFMLMQYHREAMLIAESQGISINYEDIPSPKNSGLYVMSDIHAGALTPPRKPFPLCGRNGATIEQTWLTLSLSMQNIPIKYFAYPDHHWVWYSDQDQKYCRQAMARHFAGLTNATKRFELLAFYAELETLSPTRDEHDASVPTNWTTGAPSFAKQMTIPNPGIPALKIASGFTVSTHRYGWKVAMLSLATLSRTDGVLFDGFIEDTFLWNRERSRKRNILPYLEPWMGFIHHPPEVPDWPSVVSGRIQRLVESPEWLESKKHCLGLFAMTDYLADFVRTKLGVPCEVVRYPTLVPEVTFSWEAYQNSERWLVTIGFWLRRFSTFHAIQAPGFQKVRLINIPSNNDAGMKKLSQYEAEERLHSSVNIEDADIKTVERLGGYAYDEMLSKSVVFLDLVDASAVTVIVECLVRATPLVINRHPAVVEYLGEDYPLYFESLEEASIKLAQQDLIMAAHLHMKRNPVLEKLAPSKFVEEITSSELYRKALARIVHQAAA